MNKGLGRGLSSLIPPKHNEFSEQNQQQASKPELRQASSIEIKDLSIADIDPNPMQPRQHFDKKSLEELAASIESYGLLEPIVVTQVGERWEIVAGERRYRSFKLLKKSTIPAIIRTASELERLELALIENIQREDLNPMEKANSYARLVDDFGLTQVEAAKKLGIARSSLANTIRLLDLPTEIQISLAGNKITEGHAKVLLGLATEKEQLAFFKQIVSGKAASVRDLSDAVSRGQSKKSNKDSLVEHDVKALANKLESHLGTKVVVKSRGRSGFQILIDVFSPEELKNVIKKISKK